jgi:DNA processing protein
MVGARAASKDGMARAHGLAAALAAEGVLVVSGGAVGIDRAAHVGAMSAGRPTLAALAPGLDAPYPARHRPLFDAIVAAGGTLVSALPPGTDLQKWHFPARNKIMAALVHAVVVVECGATSGSMITAQAAAGLGKLVAACPGSPGTDALIAAGAALCESAADVLAALDGRPRAPVVPRPPPESEAARALAGLDLREPRSAERVADAAGLPVLVAARALSSLHHDGLARLAPGGRYLLAAHAAP